MKGLRELGFYFAICCLLLFSCTLNSAQEKSLNMHISKYIDIRNKCHILGLIGFTYPEFAKELKYSGDSSFVKFFQCDTQKSFSNPTIRSSKKENKSIHVLFELEEKESTVKEKIVAITNDDGKTWNFLPYSIYKKQGSCIKLKRILK